MIVIIDYGLGNVGSIKNMLNYLNIECLISDDIKVIDKASKIILPGVGRFDYAMNQLKSKGLIDVLEKKAILEKVPTLGICLGAQLMCKKSEEGDVDGLGWLNADVKKFKLDNNFKIPHMGWNRTKFNLNNPSSKLFKSEFEFDKFYFVHSYYMSPYSNDDILMSTMYSFDFTSAMSKDNLFAFQFHPEKSHKYGMNILKKFSKIC